MMQVKQGIFLPPNTVTYAHASRAGVTIAVGYSTDEELLCDSGVVKVEKGVVAIAKTTVLKILIATVVGIATNTSTMTAMVGAAPYWCW